MNRPSSPATIKLTHYHGDKGLDGFARDDGFRDWGELEAFWRKEHPWIFVAPRPVFRGIILLDKGGRLRELAAFIHAELQADYKKAQDLETLRKSPVIEVGAKV